MFGASRLPAGPAVAVLEGQKRSALFNEQLGDTLQLMSASMRAGYGLLQAIDAVAEEAPSPTAEEFQRIKIETHLGRDLDDSLEGGRRSGGQRGLPLGSRSH